MEPDVKALAVALLERGEMRVGEVLICWARATSWLLHGARARSKPTQVVHQAVE